MNRVGKGVSHGAATIVNAIATGKGAAFGIDLKTWAEVTIHESPEVEVTIEGFTGEPTRLVENCFRSVVDKLMPGENLGGEDRHQVADPGVPGTEEQQRGGQRGDHGHVGRVG